MKKTLAMVLAGGRVDELSVITLFRPKAAVPFGGLYRVIDFPLSNLMNSGIDRIGILSQYRSDSLINHIGSGAAWDMIGSFRGISMLPPMKGTRSSDWYKGTADAVYQNMEFISNYDPDYVLVLSGDHVYHMDYKKLIKFHESVNADLTLAFVQVPKKGAERFGQAIIENESQEGGRILRYAEKPSRFISPWASMTVYLFSRNALDFVMDAMMKPPETKHFGNDIFPVLLDKKKVYGYKFQGPWAYTRTIDEYWQANMELLKDNPAFDVENWNVRTNLENEHILDRMPSFFGPSSFVEQSLVHHGCRIDGIVKHSIIFPGVQIEEGAVVENSILMFNTVVKKDAKLNKVLSDMKVIFGEGAQVGVGELSGTNIEYPNLLNSGVTLVGKGTHLPAQLQVGRNCIIYPNKRESDFPKTIMENGRTFK